MSLLQSQFNPSHRTKIVLIATLIAGLVSVAVGFALPKETIKDLFRSGGYSFVLVAFLLWLHAFFPKSWDQQKISAFGKRHSLAALLAILITGSSILTSPPEFRVLADETNLIAIAAAMYDSRDFFNPTQGLYYFHSFHETHHEWGKRPIFYPFLVMVAHTIFGYSGYNGFVVNAIAGFLTLFSFYFLIQRWFGRFLGLLGMGALGAIPLYVLWVTSSGFEIVNLFYAIFAFILLDRFLISRKGLHAEQLGLTLVLLAQVRYESAIFTLVLLGAILCFLPRKSYVELSYRTVLIPLLLLPVAWQRVLNLNNKYQMKDNKPAFSTDWFFENLGHAWDFFSASLERYATIPALFYVAFLGLIIAGHWLYRHRSQLSARVVGIGVVTLLCFMAQCGIMFFYYWGNFTLQYAMRLGIIFLPLIIYLDLLVVRWVLQYWPGFKRYAVMVCIGFFIYYWPIAAKNEAVNQIYVHREYKTALEFLHKNYPQPSVLVVSDRPGMYTLHRWGAVNFNGLNSRHASFLKRLRRHLYDEIIIIQKIEYSTNQPKDKMKVHKVYDLEVLYETQLNAKEYLRFSRVKHSKTLKGSKKS